MVVMAHETRVIERMVGVGDMKITHEVKEEV